MKKMILGTRRPWNWKVALVLIGLVIPAAFSILPFSLHQLAAYGGTGAEAPGWGLLVRNALINGLVFSGMGLVGLLICNRIGLGMPFVEAWVKRVPVRTRFRSAAAVGWVAGIANALTYLVLQKWVFGPPMLALFKQVGYAIPADAISPPLYGFLAAFSAGVTEETMFRLFGLSALAWLGGTLFQNPDGRPKTAVLWVANLLFALAFGAVHLRAAEALGWPLNTLIVTRTLLLNGIGGVVLGWLFWTFGLETAMLAHFFGDVAIYTFLPIIALQTGETARTIALAGVIILVLAGLVWAFRVIVIENRSVPRPKSSIPARRSIRPGLPEKRMSPALAVCTQDLSMDFESVRALDSLSLEIPPGIIFGFLGPNGAGKTTTIRLLLGLLEPTSGSARVFGLDTRTQADQIRACSGALLEHTGIYEQMSAENNLEFYGRAFRMPESERRARIQELLSEMGLWERRQERVGTWSRGMKQKLALARTMLHRPRLILLDEPTAGLDVQSAVALRKDLAALAAQQDVTIFLTTHNMTDAEKLCQRVAVIREGKLIAQGSPDELRAKASLPQVEFVGRGFNLGALTALRAHPQVTAVLQENHHLRVNMLPGCDTAALVNILVGAGARIEEIRRGAASLEDVFLTLMGD